MIPCDNYVVDLTTGKTRPHRPDLLMTWCSPVEYHPNLPRPTLDPVLSTMLGADAELMSWAQMAIGESCFGHNRLENFFIWWGPGGSGKGTFFESLKAVLGRAAMTAESKTFIEVPGHRVRDDIARLNESRLVLSSEIRRGEALDVGLIKALSGNDTQTSRQLYASYFEYAPKFTIHLQCNDLPRFTDDDSGLWRRLILVPCGPTIPDELRDPEVKIALRDPARGGREILSWLVDGAIAAAKLKRLPRPAAIQEAMAKLRGQLNPLAGWVEECLRLPRADRRDRVWCTTADLLDSYHAWCGQMKTGERFRLGKSSLFERLEQLGGRQSKRRVRKDGNGENLPTGVWIGLTLANRDHQAMLQPDASRTVMPDDEEHFTVLGYLLGEDGEWAKPVPKFQSSGTQENSPHVRAGAQAHTPPHTRTPARGDFSNPVELWNNGTDKLNREEDRSSTPVRPPVDLSTLDDEEGG